MKPFQKRDVQPNAAGCFFTAIFSFISLCLVFVHPFAALIFFVIGWVVASSINWFFCEPWEEGMPECRSRQPRQPPAQIVYRHEVTVSETVYAAPSYRPRTSFDPDCLQRVFRNPDQPRPFSSANGFDPVRLKGVFRDL
jgi:hypothetical protein